MRNRKKQFLLKPLAVLIGIGLSAYALANTAGQPQQEALFPGPFSKVPLHLQETVSSSGHGVKPNVVIQIDNSGSMSCGTDGATLATVNGWATKPEAMRNCLNRQDLGPYQPNSRIEITRRALLKILRNPAYSNNINWFFTTLFDNPRSSHDPVHQIDYGNDAKYYGSLWLRHARDFLENESKPFGRPAAEWEKEIGDYKKLFVFGPTPTAERYLDSIYLLQRALERPGVQSCQQSYVIIFSDGGQNSTGHIPMERTADASDRDAINTGFRVPSIPITTGKNNLYSVHLANAFVNSRYKRYEYIHNNPYDFEMRATSTGVGTSTFDPDRFLRYDGYLPYSKGWNWSTSQPASPHSGAANYAVNRTNFLKFFAESVYQRDLAPQVSGKQNIQTFTISFGFTEEEKAGKAYQTLSRGSVSDPSFGLRGQVINADSEQELDKAFNRILGGIVTASKFEPPASYSSISPAVTSEDLTRKVPNMAAAVHLDLASGSSELRFYQAQGDDKKFTVNTSTYTKPSFGNRRFIINVNGVNTWLERLQSTNEYFAIPATSSNAGEWTHSLVPWLMRQGSDDNSFNRTGNALKYRVRSAGSPDTRSMGDVIDSPVSAYGPVEHGRQKYLITAANDGMVYLFRSQNDPNHPYDLKLNYIPADMQRESATDTLATHFKHIVHPEYVSDPIAHPHRYMINGGIMIRKMDSNGHQPIFMAGAMGQGGRGVYALNVGGPHRHTGQPIGIDADQNSWTSTVPLFETPKGEDNIMGYTTGTPQIGRLSFNRNVDQSSGHAEMTTDYTDVRYGVFVGSGVRAPGRFQNGRDESESALYIYNAMENVNVGINADGSAGNPNINTMKAGELIKKLPVPQGTGFGGLAQPAIIDTNLDGVIDVVYAGDYSGGLYRFDLRGPKDSWSVRKIFQTADKQPITAAPAVLRQDQNTYVVIFGTGSDLFQEDLANKDSQSVYGIYDNLADFNPQEKRVGDLVEQTITKSTFSLNGSTVNTRILSDNPVGDQPKGWYFRLPDPGERVVVKPGMLLKTALIVTRQYREETSGNPQNSGVCSASETQRTRSSGKSWIMQVKGDNGGNIPGKDGDDVYAYADFLKQRDPSAPKKRADMIPSGVENNSLYSFTLFAGNGGENQYGGYGNSGTAHGDVTNSPGADTKLNVPPPRDLLCYDRDDNKLLGGLSGTGLNAESTEVHAKICSNAGIRRLSWREIF